MFNKSGIINRKTLLKNHILMKQAYYEKMNNQTTMGLLVHLNRFYCKFKPNYMLLTEQIVEFLKTQPNGVSEYKTLKEHFGAIYSVAFKKLFKTSSFQQFVETDLVKKTINISTFKQ